MTNKQGRWQKHIGHSVAMRGGLAWPNTVDEVQDDGQRARVAQVAETTDKQGRGQKQLRRSVAPRGPIAWHSRMAASRGRILQNRWQGHKTRDED